MKVRFIIEAEIYDGVKPSDFKKDLKRAIGNGVYVSAPYQSIMIFDVPKES